MKIFFLVCRCLYVLHISPYKSYSVEQSLASSLFFSQKQKSHTEGSAFVIKLPTEITFLNALVSGSKPYHIDFYGHSI